MRSEPHMLDPQKPNYHKIITESMLIIERGLLHEIDIDSLIDNTPLPNDEFLKHFEKIASESPHQFQNRLRTEYALMLLLVNKASIDDVYAKAAFPDHDTFSESFLKHFHQDPEDMINKQRLQHDLISFSQKPVFGSANQEERLYGINEKIVIQNREDLQVQSLRHTGSYEETYKPWLGLVYRAGAKTTLNQNSTQLGITWDYPSITDAKHLRYDACIQCEKNIPSLIPQTISGGLYAIYMHEDGPASLNAKLTDILCIWLNQSNYRLRLKPIYYIYKNFGTTSFIVNQIKITVFIPIEKTP